MFCCGCVNQWAKRNSRTETEAHVVGTICGFCFDGDIPVGRSKPF